MYKHMGIGGDVMLLFITVGIGLSLVLIATRPQHNWFVDNRANSYLFGRNG